ncbi:PilZ domain-containing protein [Desulfobotulus mexicanus]|uniref:PilZ domain-containing protein n=1 Tax=Desulfobotulus mexicanus TaxID=2586642 RepID=A0A5S5MFU5_9BACT|nr:PilZ domain-containing protein [Desulfobotulus mexicanus]TYT74584.1 hypothetical protein FIM25_09445 [Desulfobotulus mexicanus]
MKTLPPAGAERRKHPRFRALPNTVAILNSNPIRIGQVLDISDDGLSFSYVSNLHWPAKSPDTNEALILSCKNLYFRLQSHQYSIVADQSFEPAMSFSHIPIRRMSLILSNLNPKEQGMLKEYRRNG